MLDSRKVVLALETATPVCSVALKIRSGEMTERKATGMGVHSEKLFLFAKDVFDECNTPFDAVDTIIVNKGPGSYTGLRIGASAAKGLMFGKGKKLISADSLACIAAGAVYGRKNQARIHAVINARRTHLYHQLFNWDGVKLSAAGESGTKPIAEIEAELRDGDILAGTGIQRIDSGKIKQIEVLLDEQVISAKNMIFLSETDTEEEFSREESPEMFEPVYQTFDVQ